MAVGGFSTKDVSVVLRHEFSGGQILAGPSETHMKVFSGSASGRDEMPGSASVRLSRRKDSETGPWSIRLARRNCLAGI